MIHKYGWRGTKLRDNKILHTYFITTWENDLSRRIAESANVHGLAFLSIVRGMQIFAAKSRLQWLSNASVQSLMAENFQPHGIARGYSRSRRRATRRDGLMGGRSLIEKRLTAFLSRTYNAVQRSVRRQRDANQSSSVFLPSAIGI